MIKAGILLFGLLIPLVGCVDVPPQTAAEWQAERQRLEAMQQQREQERLIERAIRNSKR